MDNEILKMLKEMDNNINARLNKMDSDINARFDKMDSEIKLINTKLDENTQILRALEHKADINKAEHDKMSNDIAYIKGDVTAIKKDITNVELITASNWGDIAKLKAVK